MQVIGKQPDPKHPLGIYIHIPFCKRKCPYCHFYVVRDHVKERQTFISALKKEWQMHLPNLLEIEKNYEITSIYFGGGTPSLLTLSELETLLSSLFSTSIPLADLCEITIEANPHLLSKESFVGYKSLGINRISFGVQSLDDALLHSLGREHTSLDAIQGVEDAHRAGFTNISMDLLYDIPNQTIESFRQTLDLATTLPITHLSLYNLTIEPETAFYAKRDQLRLPTEKVSSALLGLAVDTLSRQGLARYEISAFAKPGYISKHNTGYWQYRPFLGLGPSAFSYIEGKRFQNTPHLRKYMEKIEQSLLQPAFEEHLQGEAATRESIAVGLRMLCGIDTQRLTSLATSIQEDLKRLLEEGYLVQTEAHLTLSERGITFYDYVAQELVFVD